MFLIWEPCFNEFQWCHIFRYYLKLTSLQLDIVSQATKKAAAGAKNKKFELTEEQKQEIREAFDLFDTDGSGKNIFSSASFTYILRRRDHNIFDILFSFSIPWTFWAFRLFNCLDSL